MTNILDGLLIPFNLTVDLTMHGDCHAKPDDDLQESYNEVLRIAAEHGVKMGMERRNLHELYLSGAKMERERCARVAEKYSEDWCECGESIAAAIRGLGDEKGRK